MRILTFLLGVLASKSLVPSVKNLRPVVPGLVFRSATLDNLSISDAEKLLNGLALDSQVPLGAVIDLRSDDEIKKGANNRTDGAQFFYSALAKENRLIQIPVLKDVDAFWDEAIARMDPLERTKATLQTAFQGGALDRAAARNLEKGGLPMLYSIMMVTGSRPLASALLACVEESKKGPVLFHCQKGKDRTGVLAMLIHTCLGQDDATIIDEYSLSAELLGGDPGNAKPTNQVSSSMVDWNYFRGSPASAMEVTLSWTRARYGSMSNYLDSIGFDEIRRKALLEQFSSEDNNGN